MVKNIESTCFGRSYKVSKNSESTCFGRLHRSGEKHRVNVFWLGYIKWRKTSSQPCFGRLYKVAKNIESTCFGWLYNVAKTSSQRVLVGYIKWRKHRVNVFW